MGSRWHWPRVAVPDGLAARALRRVWPGCKNSLPDAVAMLVLAGATAGIFRDVLLQGKLFWELDTLLFYFPMSTAIRDAVIGGRLPLWTPDIFAGHPLLGDGEAGMLYPINQLLWRLLPNMEGFLAGSGVHIFLAGAFTYGFLRALRVSRLASLLGGLCFSLGSFLVGQLHHVNVVACVVWLPLALRWSELALQTTGRRRWVRAIIAGVPMGMGMLTLHINAWLMSWLILGSYVGYRWLVGPVAGETEAGSPAWRGVAAAARSLARAVLRMASRLARSAVFLGAVGVVALGIGAVQFLPTWELAQQSPRYSGVDYRFATSFAMPPANVLTLVFPYFFRNLSNQYWSPWFRWDNTVYVGIAPLLLALMAVVLKRSRIMLYFLLLVVAGLLLAMGDYLPMSPYVWLWRLPLFSMTRVPSRFLLFAVLGLSVLAALGLDALRERLRPERQRDVQGTEPAPAPAGSAIGQAAQPEFTQVRAGAARKLGAITHWLGRAFAWRMGKSRIGILLMLALFVAATIALTSAVPRAHEWVIAHPQESAQFMNQYYPRNTTNPALDWPAPNPLEALKYSLDLTSVWTPRSLLWFAIGSLILLLWYGVRTLAPLWRVLLVILVMVDLVPFAAAYHSRMRQVDLLASSGIARYLQEHARQDRVLAAWPVTGTGPNRLMPLNVADASGYSSLTTRRWSDYSERMQRSPQRLLDLMGVRYVVATAQSDWLFFADAATVFTEGDAKIYERATNLPRARLLFEAVHVSSGRDALIAMSGPGYYPGKTVVLEGTLSLPQGDGAPAEPGRAEILDSKPERVIIRTVAAQAGYLVLADTFYPGWQALVDGNPVEIARADHLFRAVVVPAGDHVVEFRYVPFSVAVGATITVATSAGILAMLGIAAASRWWRGRKKQDRPEARQMAAAGEAVEGSAGAMAPPQMEAHGDR